MEGAELGVYRACMDLRSRVSLKGQRDLVTGFRMGTGGVTMLLVGSYRGCTSTFKPSSA